MAKCRPWSSVTLSEPDTEPFVKARTPKVSTMSGQRNVAGRVLEIRHAFENSLSAEAKDVVGINYVEPTGYISRPRHAVGRGVGPVIRLVRSIKRHLLEESHLRAHRYQDVHLNTRLEVSQDIV